MLLGLTCVSIPYTCRKHKAGELRQMLLKRTKFFVGSLYTFSFMLIHVILLMNISFENSR